MGKCTGTMSVCVTWGRPQPIKWVSSSNCAASHYICVGAVPTPTKIFDLACIKCVNAFTIN